MTLDHDPRAFWEGASPHSQEWHREETRMVSTQGPFPDPGQIHAYEQASPGAGAFVLQEAAKAEEARRTLALESQKAQARQKSLAAILALAACGMAFATGSVSLLESVTFEGLAVSGTGLVGLVLAFLKAWQGS